MAWKMKQPKIFFIRVAINLDQLIGLLMHLMKICIISFKIIIRSDTSLDSR